MSRVALESVYCHCSARSPAAANRCSPLNWRVVSTFSIHSLVVARSSLPELRRPVSTRSVCRVCARRIMLASMWCSSPMSMPVEKNRLLSTLRSVRSRR